MKNQSTPYNNYLVARDSLDHAYQEIREIITIHAESCDKARAEYLMSARDEKARAKLEKVLDAESGDITDIRDFVAEIALREREYTKALVAYTDKLGVVVRREMEKIVC